MKKCCLAITVLILALTADLYASSQNDDTDAGNLQAVSFVFIGNAGDCGSAPGSRIVTSAWLAGMGLPDDSTSPNPLPGSRDPHFGLLLSKNGPTPDCSAAGARIAGVENMPVTELGFDYRNGTHCGAGAPRFNLVTDDNVLHFVGGCSNGVKTPAPQDPLEWTRVRFSPAQEFPPVATGANIKSLSIIFDEGTDTPTLEDPRGVGLAVLDNIDVNGQLITRGKNQDNNSENRDDH